jgi:hypothetical protein
MIVLRPTRVLPLHYKSMGRMDIVKDTRLLIRMNIWGTALFIFSGLFFLQVPGWLRPGEASTALSMTVSSLGGAIRLLALLIGVTALMIVVHEGTHGLFFWLFTRSRPVFTFHGYYASASAPGWYLPKNQFMLTTLAPFVLISAASVMLLAFVPPIWILPVVILATMNASGAIGDLMVAGWLARQPASCLAFDEGSAVTLFVPGEELTD